MKYFLIEFDYDHWCQGYEDARTSVLVHATSFGAACSTISKNNQYTNARNFINKTLSELSTL